MIAANKGKSDEVEFLVAHGADVNATTTGGCTALMFASEKGHLGIVDFLLAHSAQVNIASSKVRHDTTHDQRHDTN
jgi:ankyrin repeat protein